MKVYIDTREQDTVNRVLDYYNNHKENYPNIESIEAVELQTGDMCTADDLFGIERKSTNDFLISILGGRLKQQLYELRNKYQIPLLVIEGYEGIMDCILKNPQVHPNVIKGAVTSALTHNGVPIQFVGGLYVEYILDTINKLYDGKREEYEVFGYTTIRRSVSSEDFFKYFVTGLPGIKGIIGLRLAKHFKTVDALVNAPVEELMQVKGIGKEKATNIKSIIGNY